MHKSLCQRAWILQVVVFAMLVPSKAIVDCDVKDTNIWTSVGELLTHFKSTKQVHLVCNSSENGHLQDVLERHGLKYSLQELPPLSNSQTFNTLLDQQNLLFFCGQTDFNIIGIHHLVEVLLISGSVDSKGCLRKPTSISRTYCLEADKRNHVFLWKYEFQSRSLAGVWSVQKGWNLFTSLAPEMKLHGKELTIGTMPYPYAVTKETVNGSTFYSGLFVAHLHELSSSLGFSYRIIEPGDKSYGSDFDGDGQYNGIVGMAQRNEIDIGLAGFTQTKSRKKAVGFLEYIVYSRLALMLKRPENIVMYSFLSPFKPLQSYVWIALVVLVPLCAICLFVFVTLHKLLKSTDQCSIFGLQTYLLKEYVKYFAAIAFAQSQNLPGNSSKSNVVRTVVVSVWLIFLIMQTAYVANLISFISSPIVLMPINSLKDLAEQHTHKIGLMKGSSHEILFRTSNSQHLKKIWQKIKSDPDSLIETKDMPTKGFQRVKTEDFVLIVEDLVMLFELGNDCTLVLAKERFFPRYISFITPKNWIYAGEVNDKIFRLRESGILDLPDTFLLKNVHKLISQQSWDFNH